ncbi:sensor histidine kinase [Pseudoduganella sp. FT55W]|uniref:histidine kinase n=1 Tax=Duganella rivi TaxID=2666083 RepID=A0A7X4GQM4_9BURK|nr:HAMP domain-containing sensor histidine kinase [Duganella rivi]MYM67887.1 sensor histidine kinase [Duganella rivi]
MIQATDANDSGYELSATSLAVLAMREEVFDLWLALVRSAVEQAIEVPRPLLINTLPAFYDNIAEAMTPSFPRAHGASHTTSMSAHGGERARMTPFRADQIILEYQLFRDAIATVAHRNGVLFTPEEWQVVVQSIDVAVRDAIREFSAIHESIRERMAATLSHDMANPLSLIVAGSQLIALAPDVETARRTALKIRNGATRLGQMMIELVDALTFDRGVKPPLSLSQFDIKDLIHDLAQEFNVMVGGRVEVEAPPIIGYWCKSSMLRALENLLTNAFKYGDGKRVRIKAEEIHGRLMLTVHNTGNPVPDEQQERIFEYLRREENGNGKHVEGWGIGLPFVRSVAEGHGGSAAVDSAAATGTTFIIDIPVDCRPYVATA